MILWDNSYVYATDPNKNVRVKRFPNDWIPGTWVEEFIDYKPFGELKNYVANPPRFMFSSEEYMSETGMYHYLYRAYSPSLARFITRDPIAEAGGVNLYCFVNNNPISRWDIWGLNWGDLWASIRNPFSAWDAKAAADIANELSYKYAIETNNVVGYHNGPADALRHCIWNCEMTRTIGAEKAKVFGDSHEINPPSARETQMDLHNNKVGRELGASEQCEDKEKNCADLCKEALDNGKLVQFEYDISEKYYTDKTNIIPTGSHLTTMQQYQPTDPGEYKQSYPYSTTDYGIINGMYNAVN